VTVLTDIIVQSKIAGLSLDDRIAALK